MTRQIEAGALQADGSIMGEPTMSAEHVADAVLYMASLPLNANVLFITVMASGMPFVGRG
jgi:NADP-dependent 3-hydroxy acid dehydrogenase YdfG